MNTVLRVLDDGEGGRRAFWCPGCMMAHQVAVGGGRGPRWAYNGNEARPTFTPSIKVTWSEPSDNPDEFDDRSKDVHKVCHSYVTDGWIRFLSDCTHALAGQTLDLPTWRGY